MCNKNGLFGRRLRGYVCAQMILTNCALTFNSEDIGPSSVEAIMVIRESHS